MRVPAGVAAHRTGEQIRIENNAVTTINKTGFAVHEREPKDKTDAAEARKDRGVNLCLSAPLRLISNFPANRRRRAHTPAMMPEQRRRTASDMISDVFTLADCPLFFQAAATCFN